MAAMRLKGKPLLKAIYIFGVIAYLIVLFSGLLVLFTSPWSSKRTIKLLLGKLIFINSLHKMKVSSG